MIWEMNMKDTTVPVDPKGSLQSKGQDAFIKDHFLRLA